MEEVITMNEQLSLFQATYDPFQFTKPIRLIECFGGIGAQSKALEILGAKFEHYKLVEWAVPSIKAYNCIHIKDFSDYSKGLTKEELIKKVNGVSINYNEPVTVEQLSKKSLEWLQDTYNNMVATHDTCPNISQLKGSDLNIERERERESINTFSLIRFHAKIFQTQDLEKVIKKGAILVLDCFGKLTGYCMS